ncbi:MULTISPECIES: hypothetical protein [Pseudomonas]|uniref:hypothetical protein n=1 Tax=Pseudomonas TaxID=286 RepID=UPI001D074B3D|nr:MULTISPECIES: hypothetical protein [Pseudomonas]MCX4216634.1 hypothetical protein [Pseudomonas sp. MCal1]UIN57626.1 hypothetical protein LXN51_23470 [Pseudomonas kribbensis]
MKILEQVINLLPQLFEWAPDIGRHGHLTGFCFRMFLHLFQGIAHFRYSSRIEGAASDVLSANRAD